MAFPNWIGSHRRLWTREHVVERLAQAAKELPGSVADPATHSPTQTYGDSKAPCST